MENKIVVNVINKSNNPLPKYETSQSAGLDIRADFSKNDLNHPIKLFGDEMHLICLCTKYLTIN